MAKKDRSTEAPAQTKADNAQPTGQKLLRKITIKDVVGKLADKLEELIAAKGKTVPLMRVYGIARRYKAGQTDKGEFVKFVGQFAATNLSTGDEFISSACILPNFVGESIHAAMQGESGDEMNETQWAFQIGAHYDATAVTKYVYDVQPLKSPGQSDALTLLRQTVDSVVRLAYRPSDDANSG